MSRHMEKMMRLAGSREVQELRKVLRQTRRAMDRWRRFAEMHPRRCPCPLCAHVRWADSGFGDLFDMVRSIRVTLWAVGQMLNTEIPYAAYEDLL